MLFWLTITLSWSVFFYSSIMIVGCIWFITALFLNYKFKEINELIERSVRIRDKDLLIKSIIIHNSVAVLTHRLNKYLNVLVFIVYYIGTPALQLQFYVSHEKSTVLALRFVCLVAFLSIFSMVFLMNLMSANLIKSAHKSDRLLYTFLIRNRLSLRNQLDIQSFIERLSGCPIGFYCLNMFPMNNPEFFQYLATVCTNYILIMTNIKNLKSI